MLSRGLGQSEISAPGAGRGWRTWRSADPLLPTAAPLELRQFDHGEPSRSYSVKFGGRLLVLKKEKEPPDGPSGLSVPREYR